jgi:hypothetical protein
MRYVQVRGSLVTESVFILFVCLLVSHDVHAQLGCDICTSKMGRKQH